VHQKLQRSGTGNPEDVGRLPARPDSRLDVLAGLRATSVGVEEFKSASQLGKAAASNTSFSPVNFSNALVGLSIAKDSFPEQDMIQIYREYRALLYSNGEFFEPSISNKISVVSDVIVYRDSEPAGIAGVYRCGEDADTMWLSWFAVRNDLRGKGLGQEILEHCEQIAVQHGAKHFAAYTEDAKSNESCHRLYKKCGYSSCEPLLVEGVSMRVFRKPLSSS